MDIVPLPKSDRDKYRLIESSDSELEKSDFSNSSATRGFARKKRPRRSAEPQVRNQDKPDSKVGIESNPNSNSNSKKTEGLLLDRSREFSKPSPIWDLEEERPCEPSESRKEADFDPITNTDLSDGYRRLLKLAKLWHIRLGHLSLKLMKKSSKVSSNMTNFDKIREPDFVCRDCDRSKAVKRPSSSTIENPPEVLDILERDTFKVKPIPHNKCPIGLFIVDRKSRFR